MGHLFTNPFKNVLFPSIYVSTGSGWREKINQGSNVERYGDWI
jgi:hypothetical protein